jgi:hypothetical protein
MHSITIYQHYQLVSVSQQDPSRIPGSNAESETYVWIEIGQVLVESIYVWCAQIQHFEAALHTIWTHFETRFEAFKLASEILEYYIDSVDRLFSVKGIFLGFHFFGVFIGFLLGFHTLPNDAQYHNLLTLSTCFCFPNEPVPYTSIECWIRIICLKWNWTSIGGVNLCDMCFISTLQSSIPYYINTLSNLFPSHETCIKNDNVLCGFVI